MVGYTTSMLIDASVREAKVVTQRGGGGARKAPATEPDVCALGWNPAKELSALERWAVTGTKRQFRTYGDGTARGESQMRSRHARTRTEPLFIAHRYDDAVG